jgi:hypothetical protein
MKIFAEVPVESADAFFEPAVLALLRRAREQGLLTDEVGFRERHWSLGELLPDDDDFGWLCDWARRLDATTVRNGLRAAWDQSEVEGMRLASREVLGWLLLFLAGECTRREGLEGNPTLKGWGYSVPWEVVRRDATGTPRFKPDVDQELFSHGLPTRLHREALEAAAVRLHLRHSFSADGLAESFSSVFLQIGLTRRGCLERLHLWLDGNEVPDAYERLLRGQAPSESFNTLYAHLYHFRHGNIPEDQLRDCLALTPWLLPTWTDDIVACCVKEAEQAPPLSLVELPILEQPRLLWAPPAVGAAGVPSFASRLRDLSSPHLNAPSYRLLVSGRTVATLQRAEGGKLAIEGGTDEVVLPIAAAQVPVCLIGDDGAVVQSFILDPWSPTADVNVYHLPDGTRLADPFSAPLDPAQSYAVLVAEGLTVEPGTTMADSLPGVRLFLLNAGWPAETRVLADGHEVWSPVRPPASEPDWTAGVTLTRRGASGEVTPGDPVQLIVGHPAEVVVQYILVNGRPVAFTRTADTRTLTSRTVPFDPASVGSQLAVSLGLAQPAAGGPASEERSLRSDEQEVAGIEVVASPGASEERSLRRDEQGGPAVPGCREESSTSGRAGTLAGGEESSTSGRAGAAPAGAAHAEDQTCRAVRFLDVSVVGAARLDAGAWVVLKGGEALTTEQCRQSPFRLWLPLRRHGRSIGWSEWALMEGDLWLSRAPRLPRPLPGASGAGAALTIRHGPYNSFGDELSVAREVRDHGLIRGVVLDPPDAPRVIRLELAGNVSLLPPADPAHLVPPHAEEREPIDAGARGLWWDASGACLDLTLAPVSQDGVGHWWEATLPEQATRPLAVAVAQVGFRLGAWWPHDWAETLQRCPLPAGEAASLIRWLQLPLLNPDTLPLIRQFALREPGAVLAAWIAGKPPQGLDWRLEEDGWLSAVRAVFKGWQPDLAGVDTLLDAIEEHTRISPLMVALALTLLRVDPLLMGRAVRCYMQEHHQKRHGEKAAKAFLQQMTFDVAELPPGTSRQKLREYRTALVWDCATAMRVNDQIVRALLRAGVSLISGTELEPAQQLNLDAVMDVCVPFRRALGLGILEAVAQSMS